MNLTRPASQLLASAGIWLSPRARFLGPFLIAGLLGWSGILRLRPHLEATAELTRRQSEGAHRVQSLEQQLQEIESGGHLDWNDPLVQSLTGDPAGIVRWLSETERTARRLGWNLQPEIGDVGVQQLQGRQLLRVPVRLKLTPESPSTNASSFGRLIQFGAAVLQDSPAPKILGLSVVAAATGVSGCQLDVELRILPPIP